VQVGNKTTGSLYAAKVLYLKCKNNSLALDGNELLLNAAVSAELVLPTREVALPCLSDETTAQKMFNAVSNCLDQLPLMQEFQPSNFPSGLYSTLARNLQHNTLVSEGKTVFQSCWVILKSFTPELVCPKYLKFDKVHTKKKLDETDRK